MSRRIAGMLGLWLGLAVAGCRVEPPAEAAAVERPGSASESPSTPALAAVIPASEPPPPPPEPDLGVADVGVFSDLDDQVQLQLPGGLEPERLLALVDEHRALLLLYADHWPIKIYPLLTASRSGARALALDGETLWLRPGDHAELAPLLLPGALRRLPSGGSPPPGDRDDDGIPDPVDLSIGAVKTTLDAAAYNQDYFTLDYPGGDVPRELAACTDVIVRALRNAGVDLQVEVHEDIARAPRRYPMVERANPDIDHRRVRTLLPWFRRHWLPVADDAALAPGDVIFMDTISSRAGPDHIGIVGDRQTADGRYLIANNWTDGSTTAFMDLLAFVAVTDRFRAPPAAAHAGPIPATATQLVLVRPDGWDEHRGQARRFEREHVGGPWRPVGPAFAVVLGRAGSAWGRGLHGDGPPAGLDHGGREREGASKREGDGRSPAGVFTIGRRYAPPGPSLRCVDDPASRAYAAIVDAAAVDVDWASAEAMAELYAQAIVIEHNHARVAGAGSCIFLHAWAGPDEPVTGCTAMAEPELDALAGWLRPGAVLVNLPASSYARLRGPWSLPELDAVTAGDDGDGG